MKIENCAHKISSFQRDGKWIVRVERILSDGRMNYLNDHELPDCTAENKWKLFEEVMGNIGKGIDSPGVREHFRVMEDD